MFFIPSLTEGHPSPSALIGANIPCLYIPKQTSKIELFDVEVSVKELLH